jgi:hypothetical protein
MATSTDDPLVGDAAGALQAAEKRAERDFTPDIAAMLRITADKARKLIADVGRLYTDRMMQRFTDLRFNERLKRTNPFLLQVRGVKTVRQWAENQVTSALFASEEEAIGHVLETIAKACYPGGREPSLTEDFDLEVSEPGKVTAFQIKMSWDCMPMSSRKNLSNTILRCREHYREQGIEFKGVFAPCYGRAETTKPPGQEYISKRSREFWAEVGAGDPDYDFKVGQVCRLLCSEFRAELNATAIPNLINRLATEGARVFGDQNANIDYERLFRVINR